MSRMFIILLILIEFESMNCDIVIDSGLNCGFYGVCMFVVMYFYILFVYVVYFVLYLQFFIYFIIIVSQILLFVKIYLQ